MCPGWFGKLNFQMNRFQAWKTFSKVKKKLKEEKEEAEKLTFKATWELENIG